MYTKPQLSINRTYSQILYSYDNTRELIFFIVIRIGEISDPPDSLVLSSIFSDYILLLGPTPGLHIANRISIFSNDLLVTLRMLVAIPSFKLIYIEKVCLEIRLNCLRRRHFNRISSSMLKIRKGTKIFGE